MQVGTVSQGIRASGATISAPITNPTLTLEGTDLNVHQLARMRDPTYSEQDSPGDDTRDGPLSASSRHTSRTKSIGESGSSAGGFYSSGGRKKEDSMGPPSSSIYSGRSGTAGDFGTYPISPSSSTRTSNLPSSRSIAPSRTNGADNASVGASNHGKYPSSVISNGSDAVSTVTSQIKEHLPQGVRESFHNLRQSYYETTGGATNSSIGEFNLTRPENPEEIEAMFQRIAPERDIGEGVNMTLDQKWGIVYAHEQDRWNQQKKKKVAATGNGPSAVYAKDTPQWYLKKFMDQTITAKHVGSLTVSLRSLPIECVLSSCTR
jgi:cytokinesis protein